MAVEFNIYRDGDTSKLDQLIQKSTMAHWRIHNQNDVILCGPLLQKNFVLSWMNTKLITNTENEHVNSWIMIPDPTFYDDEKIKLLIIKR